MKGPPGLPTDESVGANNEGIDMRGTTEGCRDGMPEVLVEHITGEGGELRSEGPTRGKATPGHDELL